MVFLTRGGTRSEYTRVQEGTGEYYRVVDQISQACCEKYGHVISFTRTKLGIYLLKGVVIAVGGGKLAKNQTLEYSPVTSSLAAQTMMFKIRPSCLISIYLLAAYFNISLRYFSSKLLSISIEI